VIDFSTDGDDHALAEVLPDLHRGDRIVVHEGDCASHEGRLCDCDPIAVHGPSGKA
jgi:hypothetical protein